MKKTINNAKPAGVEKKSWLKTRVIPLSVLLVVIAIVVGVFYFYQKYPERIDQLQEYGYLGAFLVSLVSNASIILPIPGILILFALGTAFNPVLVGLAGGVGAAIGEMSGYMAGYSGRGIVPSENRLYARLEGWMRRWGTLTIFIFTLVPFFPFDLAGVAAGALRFPVWKFVLVCWLGRTILYIGIAWAGALGWEAVLRFLG